MLMRSTCRVWGLCLLAAGLLLMRGMPLLAGIASVGAPLDWRVLDKAELGDGYAAAMVVADWDKDGASEVLVPRWGGPAYEAQEMFDRRSDLLELDGTARKTGVLGEQLGNSSVAWDYTGDGIPEIACDSRKRGGLAYDKWYADKAAKLSRELEQQLAPLRKRQQVITEERERLSRQGGSAARLNELAAEDDALFEQIDSLRFGGKYSMTDTERKQGQGFFVRSDTSIINLAGQEIAKLPGRSRSESMLLLGWFTGASTLQLMLGPAYFSREIEPSRTGGRLRMFAPGGKVAAKWDWPACLRYQAAGDIDGDGQAEVVGRRLGYAPYAFPLAEIAMFDPGAPGQPRTLFRLATKTPGAWPAACLDLDEDGRAEVILSNGLVYNPALQATYQLEPPVSKFPDFLDNSTAPQLVLCDLDGTGHPELWAAVAGYQLVAFGADGGLMHLEDMGELITQLAVAHDANGQEYLLVQLKSRILLWRVEPQIAGGTMI
jgi:hypothetical protein